MALPVAWTPEASGELMAIAAYIANDSPRYAHAFVQRAFEAAESLALFPLAGHLVAELGHKEIREVPVRGYRMLYRVRKDRVSILAFFHGSREFPDFSKRLSE